MRHRSLSVSSACENEWQRSPRPMVTGKDSTMNPSLRTPFRRVWARKSGVPLQKKRRVIAQGRVIAQERRISIIEFAGNSGTAEDDWETGVSPSLAVRLDLRPTSCAFG